MVSIQSTSEDAVRRVPLTRRSILQGFAALSAAAALPGSLAACSPATATKPANRLIKVGWKSDLDTLNPLTTVTTESVEVLSLIYDNLLEYGLDLKPEPGLATASKQDGVTITYTLRTGVVWHDGQPFTADDVVYTFTLISKNSLGINAQFLSDLVSVTKANDTTVVATFKRPQAFDPGLVVPILPQHIWSTMTPAQIKKATNAKPIGTGPFVFKDWKQGQTASLTRNEKWWGAKPAAAGVSWTLYTNDDLMAQALKTGEVDIIPQVPPTVFTGLKGVNDVTSVTLESWSFHHIGINVDASPKSKGNPLLRDVAVRQALSCALDRNQIVQLAYAGLAEPGAGLLPPSFGANHYSPTGQDVLDNNPDKANQLLDVAGYSSRNSSGIRQSKNGKPLSFRIIAIDSTTVDVRTAQLFEAAAAKVGIKLKFSTVDSTTMASTVYNVDGPDWDIFVWGWDSGVADPDYLLGVPLTSQIGGNNDVFYSNPTYDDLYVQQSTELDPAKRQAIVLQMQKIYYADCAYIIGVYTKKLQAYRPSSWNGWTEVVGGLIFNFTRDNYLKVKPTS